MDSFRAVPFSIRFQFLSALGCGPFPCRVAPFPLAPFDLSLYKCGLSVEVAPRNFANGLALKIGRANTLVGASIAVAPATAAGEASRVGDRTSSLVLLSGWPDCLMDVRRVVGCFDRAGDFWWK
jgi:hypothetical protein